MTGVQTGALPFWSRVAPDNLARVVRLPTAALVFEVRDASDDLEMVVLPVEGLGLWGTVYGFGALEGELQTERGLTSVDDKEISGQIVVDEFLHRVLHSMTRQRQTDQRADLRENLIEAMKVARNPKALLEEFDSLDEDWSPPASTGFVGTRSPAAA